MAHAAASPRCSALERVELTADVVAVLADQHVEPRAPRSRGPARAPAAAAAPSGISVACGESVAPTATVSPRRSARCATGVARGRRIRDAVAIGVAHRDRAAASAGAALRVEPGERRVPGDVDVPVEQRRDLQLVVGVEDDVDRAAVRLEEVADDVPDHRDLRVVEHRADE